MQGRLHTGIPTAIIANGMVFACLACAGLLFEFASDHYYVVVQEDGFLEWVTFWAFVIAAALSVIAALHQRKTSATLPWFLAGVGLFCLFVALEEISWGQRLFGYRPPDYFLDRNFQQEFNLHNVVATRWRKLALSTIIVGYGVLLPLLQLWPAAGRLLTRFSVVAPPLELLPTFLAAYLLYTWYPWSHSGEWVEFFLGSGFLFAALAAARHFQPELAGAVKEDVPPGTSLAAIAAMAALAFITALISDTQRQAHPGNIAAVETELNALKADFESGRAELECSLHKRLYTFALEYEQDGLFEGDYAALRSQGLPESRAQFFIDPWNSPYWIRDRCDRDTGERVTFVYSFGPNRRRDSSRYDILDDDIGVYISLE